MSDKPFSTPQSAATGDDRNLVPAGQSPEVSLEDQVFLLWKDYRKLLITVVILAVLALAGWEVYQTIGARREAATSTAFGLASTVDAKRALARDFSGHPLAGLALLEVADDSYENARFEDAAREYATAAAALTEPLFLGRARIGQGVAALKAGQAAPGEASLVKLAQDSSALLAFRTQAYYELAAFAADTGDTTKARDTIDKLRALDPEGYWANQGTALRVRLGVDDAPVAAEAPAGDAK